MIIVGSVSVSVSDYVFKNNIIFRRKVHFRKGRTVSLMERSLDIFLISPDLLC